ncbi:nucleolar protein 58 isoform X3 [Mirounga angustirostris]|uniref:nucleolar protein 58 isoform X3 n=1 Tax=Mirounga angustirostris TaxID=9716 RepID=UPI00313B7FC3
MLGANGRNSSAFLSRPEATVLYLSEVMSYPRSLGEGEAGSGVVPIVQFGTFRQRGLILCEKAFAFVLGLLRPRRPLGAESLVSFHWYTSSRRAAQRPDPASPCWCYLKRLSATPSLRVKLKHFEKFQDTAEALAAFTALMEGKINKQLKKVLKKIVKEAHEPLAVADAKLGGVIKEKLNLSCIHSPVVNELMRGIRSQMDGLIPGVEPREMAAMCLGLAHSLSRYRLKFSADKVDTMIVQAISLLDDLDKELNNYIMRCREWYGWHFPELGKIISDNLTYCKCLQKVGDRKNYASAKLSELLPEEVEAEVKAAAEISMGTEVSEEDICNILHLCTQVIEISEYRTQLYEYLQNRMMAIAPNVTVMVGELVGARLIAHAGSLLNLAKHAASTVQILGAEKALFRALKSRRDTPKYGLIYHASLVGQTSPKHKGKISRMLAAKTVLAIRYDAFGEDSSSAMGVENRAKLEARLRTLEDRGIRKISGTGKALAKTEKYEHKS